MLKVIGITRNGHAVVDTTGLHRIVVNGEVVEEFATESDVREAVDLWGECGGGLKAVAVPYKSKVAHAGAVA